MRYRSILRDTFLSLLLAGMTALATNGSPLASPEYFIKADEISETDSTFPTRFTVVLSGQQFEIAGDGKSMRIDQTGHRKAFHLPLLKNDFLEHVYVYNFQSDILFLCETNEGDSSAGFVVRLNGETLKPRWKSWIPTFNIGGCVVENNFAYLAAPKFLAKLNLLSGRYLWRNTNKFLVEFDHPIIEENTVVFRKDGYNNFIKLDKVSGKLIEAK